MEFIPPQGAIRIAGHSGGSSSEALKSSTGNAFPNLQLHSGCTCQLQGDWLKYAEIISDNAHVRHSARRTFQKIEESHTAAWRMEVAYERGGEGVRLIATSVARFCARVHILSLSGRSYPSHSASPFHFSLFCMSLACWNIILAGRNVRL